MKSIFDVLANASENLATLRAPLVTGRDRLATLAAEYPDLAGSLAPQIADLDAKIALLDQPMNPAEMAAFAALLLPEIVEVLKGHIRPTPHAGDAI